MTILDDDSASYVGFKQPVFKAGPNDNKVTVTLKRYNGADGEATVSLETLTTHPQKNILKFHQKEIGDKAKAGVNFTDLEKNYQVTFEDFQSEASFEIDLLTKPQEDQKLSFSI